MTVARVALGLTLLGLIVPPVSGQHIYKYRLPDGKILYTDSQSGYTDEHTKGKLEETLTEPAPAPAEVGEAMQARRESRVRNASDAAEAQARGVDKAYTMMIDARQALQNAEASLQAGLEPLPGERLGNVDGNTRLSPAYWARVRGLRHDVEAARDRLDRATNAWVQAR